jgi:hypothetical protein
MCLSVTLNAHCLSCWVLKYGLLTLRSGFDSGQFHVEFVVYKVTLWQFFSPSASVFLCNNNSSSAPFSSTCCFFRKTSRPSLAAFHKAMHCINPYLHYREIQTCKGLAQTSIVPDLGAKLPLRYAWWYEGSEVICWPAAFTAKCVHRPWLQYPRQRRG